MAWRDDPFDVRDAEMPGHSSLGGLQRIYQLGDASFAAAQIVYDFQPDRVCQCLATRQRPWSNSRFTLGQRFFFRQGG